MCTRHQRRKIPSHSVSDACGEPYHKDDPCIWTRPTVQLVKSDIASSMKKKQEDVILYDGEDKDMAYPDWLEAQAYMYMFIMDDMVTVGLVMINAGDIKIVISKNTTKEELEEKIAGFMGIMPQFVKILEKGEP